MPHTEAVEPIPWHVARSAMVAALSAGRLRPGRRGNVRALRRRYLEHPDPVERDALVVRFLPLARRIAVQYQRPGESLDDLFQVACFGLLKAVDRFDVHRGVAFSSYAVPTITGEVRRHFRDSTWAVHVPRGLQERALRVERVIAELTREIGRQPSVGQIARIVDTTPEDVLEAMEAYGAYRAASLQTPVGGGDDDSGRTLGDSIGTTDDGFARADQRADVEALLRSLTARQRVVVRLRFEEDLPRAQIGALLGMSQIAVSGVLRQAIARLRAVADPQAA